MKAILFDLDGTLLPMNQEAFIEEYTKEFSKVCEPYGYSKEKFGKALWIATKAMLKNHGATTNEEVFWETMDQVIDKNVRSLYPILLRFYENEFYQAQKYTIKNPRSKECIQIVKQKGYKIILATNPVFPPIATHTRVRWAGLNVQDFDYITTYDNSYYCKPNPEYYKGIIKENHLFPEECLMVGNDVRDDMCAKSLGMDTYLITDCLINTEQVDINQFPHGSMEDFYHKILEIEDLNKK